MRTRNGWRLTTLPLSFADYLEIWEPQIPGNLRASTGIALPLFLHLSLPLPLQNQTQFRLNFRTGGNWLEFRPENL